MTKAKLLYRGELYVLAEDQDLGGESTESASPGLSFVEFLSERDMIRREGEPNVGVISITDFWRQDHAPLRSGWKSVLRLKFDDIDYIPGAYGEKDVPFDEGDAKKIIGWLNSHHNKVVGIYVHCWGGISRSAAVAKFAAEKYGLPFDHSYADYNKLVYRILREVDESPEAPARLSYAGFVYERVATPPEKEVEKLLKDFLPLTKFGRRAYAVGGYVRDSVMGINSKDLDIVVELEGGAEELAKSIKAKFPHAVTTPRQLGAGYPIWHIVFKDDVLWSGDEYRTAGAELDLADTQKEAFPDPNSRQRVTVYGTLEEDIKRRDFTVNMLLRKLSTGELIDMTGSSVLDVKSGLLRAHPEVSPNQMFRDDPLRMMRLVRFMAKYDWTPDADVVEAMVDEAARIKIVSWERIRDELTKMMVTGDFAEAVEFMADTDFLKHILPEVDAMRGSEQSRDVHAEGDVFRHTLLVLKNSKPTVDAQLAALLHDVGKPPTKEYREGRWRNINHEKVGEEMTKEILTRLKFDNETVKRISKMVRAHMRPHLSDRWKGPAYRRFVRDLGDDMEAVLELSEADAKSSLRPSGEPAKTPVRYNDLRKRLAEVQLIPVREKPVLSGNEVMELLGLSPGPRVGEVLCELQDKTDELASEQQEFTAEDARSFLLEKYKSA